MELITIIILACGAFTVVAEISSTLTYGWLMKEEDIIKYLKRYGKFNINSFDHTIISGDIDWSDTQQVINKIREGDYISYTNISLLSKYYIAGKGRVFRWSNACKAIDELYLTSEIK